MKYVFLNTKKNCETKKTHHHYRNLISLISLNYSLFLELQEKGLGK